MCISCEEGEAVINKSHAFAVGASEDVCLIDVDARREDGAIAREPINRQHNKNKKEAHDM